LFAILGLALLLLVASCRERLARWLSDRGAVIGWIGRTLLSVSHGVDAFRRPHLLVPIMAHSLLCWLMIDIATWIGLRSIGIEISLVAVFVLQPILAFGVALPTPGGAGGYHAMMKTGLVFLFGVNEVLAVGAGILVHLVSVVPVILMGILFFWTEKLSWSDILEGVREVKSLGTGSPEEAS
jgi:uncharacterized membrane protein YbhN (UPF0104 family)